MRQPLSSSRLLLAIFFFGLGFLATPPPAAVAAAPASTPEADIVPAQPLPTQPPSVMQAPQPGQPKPAAEPVASPAKVPASAIDTPEEARTRADGDAPAPGADHDTSVHDAPVAAPLPLPLEDREAVSQPIADPAPSERAADGGALAPATEPDVAEESTAAADAAQPAADALRLLGNEVPRGVSTRLAWSPSESFSGISVPTPVLVVNGAQPGPTVCLTAAIHGDELTGIEIVRRVMFSLDPQRLNGAVIGVPIVNLQGFRRNSRYLPDRRDLNRYFPGNERGSLAARVANSFFKEVMAHCDALVDMHTGSFHRTNLPQVRADMNDEGVATLARNLGDILVLQSRGNRGTLRRAAVEQGIPAVTLEAGEPMRLSDEQVRHGARSVHALLTGMNMYGQASRWGKPEPIYYKSFWVRSNSGGILFSRVALGDRVQEGQVLGTVTDPITNARSEVAAPQAGRVIGMALNQVVMPGFAAYHIGIQTTEEHAAEPVQGLATEPQDESADEDGLGDDEAPRPDRATAPGQLPLPDEQEPDVLENS